MSNDVAELKEYVLAHASAQNLSADHVLSRITTDGDGPGSWTREWVRAGETLERDGDLLAAATHYNLARFPYVDGPARAEDGDPRVVGVTIDRRIVLEEGRELRLQEDPGTERGADSVKDLHFSVSY